MLDKADNDSDNVTRTDMAKEKKELAPTLAGTAVASPEKKVATSISNISVGSAATAAVPAEVAVTSQAAPVVTALEVQGQDQGRREELAGSVQQQKDGTQEQQ